MNFYTPPNNYLGGGGGGVCWNHFVLLSVSEFGQYLLHRSAILNQTWYSCLWCGMQKIWFTVFNVKVIVRTYEIKI